MFLTVPRDSGFFAEDCNLSMIVESTETPGTTTGYVDSVEVTVDTGEEAGGPREVTAEGLLQDGDIVKAEATDKIDATYYANKPEYGTDWDNKVLLAYDNNNGEVTSPVLYRPGYFNTVQTTENSTLSDITAPGNGAMKGAGVLYPGSEERNIKTWYCASVSNAMSSQVRFWMMLDEPDAGAGEQMWLLKDIYSLYYKYNKHGNKPYSLNISQPIFYEEYARGCDVFSFDPYVKDTDFPLNKLTDAVAEAGRVTSDNQKTIVVFWWWAPTRSDPDPTNVVNFARSFEAVKNDVDGISGWNFGGLYVPDDREEPSELRRLSTYQKLEIPELWAQIGIKNKSIS